MNIKTITFSPTGGTKAVADILARTLDPDPFDIDLTDRFADHEQVALAADDLVVIAMPCFCGRVPVLAAERFAHIRGNGARAVIVAVYGNRDFDDELVELADLAVAGGFRVVAAVSALAEHSIVREYASGRPDEADVAALRSIAERIAEKLRAQRRQRARCSRQPSVQGRTMRWQRAAGLQRLRTLRRMRRSLPKWRHRSGAYRDRRSRPLHFLHALHRHLSRRRACHRSSQTARHRRASARHLQRSQRTSPVSLKPSQG